MRGLERSLQRLLCQIEGMSLARKGLFLMPYAVQALEFEAWSGSERARTYCIRIAVQALVHGRQYWIMGSLGAIMGECRTPYIVLLILDILPYGDWRNWEGGRDMEVAAEGKR